MKENSSIIKNQVKQLVSRGITEFAIYPYGEIGKQIENILINDFCGVTYIIFDKKYDNKNILNPYSVIDYREYYFLIATVRLDVKKQVVSHLLNQGIDDKKIVKAFEYDELFIDDRENRDVDYKLIEEAKEFRTYEASGDNSVTMGAAEVIISLTSFPARIEHIEPTLKSLFQQSMRPSKVILWLAEEEFPNKRESLPVFLRNVECEFFEIHWCKDWKSYKKLIPALIEYPNAIIVTADDDTIYGRDWLKKLYDTHLKFPKDIICHRVTKMLKDKNGRWAAIPGGFDYYSEASYLNKQCGVGGVLYPINCMHNDVKEDRLFTCLAPTSDDIWFWLMGVMLGTKVRAANEPDIRVYPNNGLKESPALTIINDHGEKLFWVHFYQILHVYPELKEKLEEEFRAKKG